MSEGENVFPLDITEREPGARPWKWRPEGYLVAMLSDEDEAKRAEADLVADGFASRDIKLYTGEQILATFEIYKQQRDLADKVVGVVRRHRGQGSLPRVCGRGSMRVMVASPE